MIYVCCCALKNQPEAATEQQVGIYVFRRAPGYNPNEDNIVRSQARLLRLKLEHHFAHEGKDEPVMITIPKGRYVPVFQERCGEVLAPAAQAPVNPQQQMLAETDQEFAKSESSDSAELHFEHQLRNEAAAVSPEMEFPPSFPVPPMAAIPPARRRHVPVLFAIGGAVVAVAVLHFAGMSIPSRVGLSVSAASGSPTAHAQPISALHASRVGPGSIDGELRIAAGATGAPFVDTLGHRWNPDTFYDGGATRSGPQEIFPPVADVRMFRTVREGISAESLGTEEQSQFSYDIPAAPGVYELRLYFADPVRHTQNIAGQDTQDLRHFQVNLNGRPLLTNFDAIADAGSAPVDIRAFKDVRPAQDGKIHLDFVPGPERPFVSALELSPGTPGKLKPIRVSAHDSDFVDENGIKWSGDQYYIDGRNLASVPQTAGAKVPELYRDDRVGNFSYAIPVPEGSYTVKLHFLESFSNRSVATAFCKGAGCRVFDVTCNGTMLLHDFDIYQAAGGEFRPVVKTFHGLHPNGQGKLLISFSPKEGYAEIAGIEVAEDSH